jgi:hypothetical protein
MSDEELHNVKSQLHAHEVMCEERWKTNFSRLEGIEDKLDRMEARSLKMGAAVILFLAGLVVTLTLGA